MNSTSYTYVGTCSSRENKGYTHLRFRPPLLVHLFHLLHLHPRCLLPLLRRNLSAMRLRLKKALFLQVP